MKTCPHKDLYASICGSIIYNSLKLERFKFPSTEKNVLSINWNVSGFIYGCYLKLHVLTGGTSRRWLVWCNIKRWAWLDRGTSSVVTWKGVISSPSSSLHSLCFPSTMPWAALLHHAPLISSFSGSSQCWIKLWARINLSSFNLQVWGILSQQWESNQHNHIFIFEKAQLYLCAF